MWDKISTVIEKNKGGLLQHHRAVRGGHCSLDVRMRTKMIGADRKYVSKQDDQVHLETLKNIRARLMCTARIQRMPTDHM